MERDIHPPPFPRISEREKSGIGRGGGGGEGGERQQTTCVSPATRLLPSVYGRTKQYNKFVYTYIYIIYVHECIF